jgi:uncharacterized protein (TIGR00255 family)
MSAPLRSMTGFARVHKATPHGEITVTLKSVNHRGLDLHFHLEPEMDPFEAALRAVAKRALLRGHIDIRCSMVRANGVEHAGVNVPMLRAYLAAFRKTANEQGLDSQPDLNQALRIPGMFGGNNIQEPDPAVETSLLAVFEEALANLNQFRAREGAELGAIVRELNRSIAESTTEMESLRQRVVPAFQARLMEKLNELLRNSSLDPQRVAQEAAILADRSDIGEEIARLQIHARQLEEIVDAGGEVGKKLDFLLQEMNRESNTILSKTSGVGELGLRITELALAAKAGIEKIREQALNLE